MKTRPLLLVLPLAVLFLHVGARAQEGLRVDSLRVEGLRFLPAERVLLEFGVVTGDRLDADDLADALRRLNRTRRYRDIVLRLRELGPGSALLTLQLAEYPRITELRWEGLKKIKAEDLAEKIRIGVGSYASPTLLAEDERRILEYCREKGYHSATIRHTLTETDGRGRLVFILDEGNKTKVTRIAFAGNASLDAGRLKKVLRTRTKSINPLSWRNFNAYQPDSIQADVSRLTHLYHQEGFLDARVLETRTDFDADRDEVTVTYVVEEGTRYRFGHIAWEGNEVLDDDAIALHVPFDEGDPFDGFAMDDAVFGISTAYYDEGYLYNQVRPERRLEGDRVNVLLNIYEGPLARVREVRIVGNDLTRDKVIRRQIKIFPGELFNREKVVRSHRDIFMLRYFDDVQFEPRADPVTGDVDLVFNVAERPTGNFGAGITYSEATRLTGFLQVGAQNFRGTGRTVNFQWEFGKTVHLFNIQYIDPWFRDRPVTLSLNVYRSRSDLYNNYYEDEKRGFSVGLGRTFPWLEYSNISASYRLESVELFDFSDEYLAGGGTLAARDWPEIESSITLLFRRNSTDNPFLPSRGTNFWLSSQFAGGVLGGNLDYQRYLAHYTWYQKLKGPFVLRYHQSLGLVDGLDNPNQVPDQERFRLGGNRTYPLRGYDDYSVVPRGNSPYFGGRAMTTGAVEVVLGVNNSVQLVLPFFDFGDTWNSLSEADFTTLRRSVGLGARVEVPMMGVLGFDYAFPLDGPDEGKGRFHFKMGTDF
jgi:outer membrane protein insertion porin family